MARPKLHDFAPDQMLVSIAGAIQAQREALNGVLAEARVITHKEAAEQEAYRAAWHAAWRTWTCGQDQINWDKANPQPQKTEAAWRIEEETLYDLASLEAGGIPYDLPAFTGKELTPSARIAAQKTVRLLEGRGLVKLFGNHARAVLVTDAGWERFAELTRVRNAQSVM